MDLKKLSDQELELQMKLAVTDENKAKTWVLHVMAEVERRRLYSKNHPSLFEYCVRVLKYSGSAAQRRIDTMRAMKLIPEIENKIITGELNLTTVAQAQTFFRHEAKQDKKYSIEAKRVLLSKLENKSTAECTKTLIAISPKSVPQDKRRPLTPETTEIKTAVKNELIEKLDRIKSLLSHKNPNMTDGELLNEIADIALEKLDPARKVSRKATTANRSATDAITTGAIPTRKSLPLTAVKSRYIPGQIKKAIWIRDQGRCTHANCQSRHFLEIDHIKPLAQGGITEISNLRLLCRAHNQRAAIDNFGFQRMDKFINGQKSNT